MRWGWVLAAAVVGVVMLTGKKAYGYVAGQLVELELRPIGGGHLLRADAAAAFLAMSAAAHAAGVELHVNTAFRSMAEQERLYQLYLSGQGNLAARPGYSNHQGGIAVDIETGGGANEAFRWLNANAAEYGWKRTVSSEPWHWEYRP